MDSPFQFAPCVNRFIQCQDPENPSIPVDILFQISCKEYLFSECSYLFSVNLFHASQEMFDVKRDHIVYKKYPDEPFFVAGFIIQYPGEEEHIQEKRLEIKKGHFREERKEFYHKIFPTQDKFLKSLIDSGFLEKLKLKKPLEVKQNSVEKTQ